MDCALILLLDIRAELADFWKCIIFYFLVSLQLPATWAEEAFTSAPSVRPIDGHWVIMVSTEH